MGLTGLMELVAGYLHPRSVIFCPALWATSALFATSGADPIIIKMLHVATWIMYNCTYVITTIQCLGVALYTILNKKQTVFPEWLGWSAIAAGMVFIGVVFIPFVTTGPFIVSGTWNFYMVFGVWLAFLPALQLLRHQGAVEAGRWIASCSGLIFHGERICGADSRPFHRRMQFRSRASWAAGLTLLCSGLACRGPVLGDLRFDRLADPHQARRRLVW